jgi:hypothetical protein
MEREKLRQQAIADRQEKQIQAAVERQNKGFENTNSFKLITQLEKNVKPLRDIREAAAATKLNLTPEKGKDGKLYVQVGKVENIVTMAGKALGNVGVQTDNDAVRTQAAALSRTIANILAYMKSDPSQPVPFKLVAPLLDTINKLEMTYRDQAESRVKLAESTYKRAGLLPEEKIDAIMLPYSEDLGAQKAALEQFSKQFEANVRGSAPISNKPSAKAKPEKDKIE